MPTIRGELSIHAFSTPPKYEALSYTWGDTSTTVIILLNDIEFPIPRALYEALVQLLRQGECSNDLTPRYIWIDLICINQRDDTEKSAQVSRMQEIFAQAESVRIWLGPADEHTSLALETLKHFSTNDGTGDGSHTFAKLANTRHERRLAVQKLIQRPFFSRMWVIQEVVVSKAATAHCGPFTIDWEEVAKGLQRATGSGFIAFSEQTNKVTSIGIWRDKFHVSRDSSVRAEDLDMRLIMMDEGAKKATNLRDKIYSLRGIASDDFARGIAVDYRDTIEKVYTDCTKHLLRMRKDLRILSRVRQRGKDPSLQLPSWVPDWNLADPGGVLNRYYRFELDKRFCASGKDSHRIVVPMHGDTIHVFGTHVDKIHRIYQIKSLILEPGKPTLSIHEAKLRGLIRSLDCTETYDATGEDSWMALFRTLTADRTPLSSRISDDYRNKNFSHISVTVPRADGNGTTQISEAAWAKVSSLLDSIVDGKVFYITRNGYFGFTEELCQEDDHVYTLCGGEVPFIVRSIGDGSFLFHGETYVHGLMDGEVQGWQKEVAEIILR
ncbi:unnamed protein product [Discula destructiva]